jgi:hypothetical protein
MKTESNNIYFIINSKELKREVAWEWQDQKKQFFQTWVPTEADIVLIDELMPDERALVKAEIMHELEPELREERLRRNKKARERRNK